MPSLDQTLDEYADTLYGGEDELLRSMRENAASVGMPLIQVPADLGRMLTVLVQASRATTILEIGALFGYSTVILARALPLDGSLVSLEIDPERAELVRINLRRAGLESRATVMSGPAMDSLQLLADRRFDFVFIDADKASYPQYLEWATKLTRSGAVIVADNVWRGGQVVETAGDCNAAGAARYNEIMAQDSRFSTTLLPTRGGTDAAGISVRCRD